MLIRSTIHSLKNFLIVGDDVFMSSYVLYYYQQDYLPPCCAVSFIPRDTDTNPAEVHAYEFTIDK